MRDTIIVGHPAPAQQPDVEPLAVSAPALSAHARLLATEAGTAQVAQLPLTVVMAATDTITLDDPAINHAVSGQITVVEHLIDQGLAVTRLEVAP